MKKFAGGVISGAVLVAASLAGAAIAYKKRVIEPIEVKHDFIEENRKKAMRKSRAR